MTLETKLEKYYKINTIKMNTFEKIEILANNIEKFNANSIDVNELKLCSTDNELLNFILKNQANYWFDNYVLDLNTFIEFFSDIFEENNVFVSGEHSVYGSKTVYSFGDAKLTIYNDSVVNAYHVSKIYAHSHSTANLYDKSSCIARNESCVNMHSSECNAEVRDDSKANIYRGNAKLYDKSSAVLLEGNVETNDSSNLRTLYGGFKRVIAMDNSVLELYGSPSVEAYNSVQIKAYDLSQVNCHNNVCIESYGKSIITLNDLCNCVAHDTSVVHVCHANCVKLLDTAIGYNIQSISPKYVLQGTSYLCDFMDTNVKVENSATIKWFKNGSVFSNQIRN